MAGFIMTLREFGAFAGRGGDIVLVLMLVISGLLVIALAVKPTSSNPQDGPPTS